MLTVGGFLVMLSADDSWTSGEDFGNRDDILLRKNCARIIHRYLQKVLGQPDETADLPSPQDIPDLADCRICAPHIAQVVSKGIMEPRKRGSIRLFEGNAEVEKDDAVKFIGAVAAGRLINEQ